MTFITDHEILVRYNDNTRDDIIQPLITLIQGYLK